MKESYITCIIAVAGAQQQLKRHVFETMGRGAKKFLQGVGDFFPFYSQRGAGALFLRLLILPNHHTPGHK